MCVSVGERGCVCVCARFVRFGRSERDSQTGPTWPASLSYLDGCGPCHGGSQHRAALRRSRPDVGGPGFPPATSTGCSGPDGIHSQYRPAGMCEIMRKVCPSDWRNVRSMLLLPPPPKLHTLDADAFGRRPLTVAEAMATRILDGSCLLVPTAVSAQSHIPLCPRLACSAFYTFERRCLMCST